MSWRNWRIVAGLVLVSCTSLRFRFGSAYLFLRLSALKCLTGLADDEPVGSEEARLMTLTSVRRSNWEAFGRVVGLVQRILEA